MELIASIFSYGKNNPTVSLAIVFVFLFIYSVVILRKRRAVSDAMKIDIKPLEDKVDAEKEYANSYRAKGFYAGDVAMSQNKLDAVRKASQVVDGYNHMLLAGLAWAVPVYYLWAPLLALTLPISLALACVYPDKIRNLISKTVDSKPASE